MECISGFSVWLLSKHPSIQYAATVISIGPSVPAEPSLLSVQLHWVDHSVFFGLNAITTIDLFSGQLDYRRTAQTEAHRDLRVFVDHYGESKNKLVVNLVVGDFYRFIGFEWLPTEIKLSRAPVHLFCSICQKLISEGQPCAFSQRLLFSQWKY